MNKAMIILTLFMLEVNIEIQISFATFRTTLKSITIFHYVCSLTKNFDQLDALLPVPMT